MRGFRPPHILSFVYLASALATAAFAGPPFLNDDPEPVPFKHWEAYIFSTDDAARKRTDATGPAFEFNIGALPDLQVHLVIPFAYSAPADASSAYGPGDSEFGLKYRFIQETDHLPMAGVFPMVEIPTGDAGRGLGNGRAWWKLPVWLQKSWGPWTTYGGSGCVINTAQGQRNYSFGGCLIQRDLGERFTLGGEIFAQGRSSDDTRSFSMFNLGGCLKIAPDFQILYSLGRAFAGGRHTIGYLGLYWTEGFGKETRVHNGAEMVRPSPRGMRDGVLP